MNHKTRWLFTVLIVLGLTALACATLTGGDTPSLPEAATIAVETGEQVATQIAEITPEPIATSGQTEPTPAGGGDTEPEQGAGSNEAGADSINLADPSLYLQPTGVNTYRTSLVYSFSGQAADGSTVTSSITGEGAYSVDPYQVRFSFQTSDSAVPGETLEIVQIENMMYMVGGEFGCFSLPVTEEEVDNPYQELLDTGGTLTGQAQRIQPDETINDIPVYVYEITTANLDVSDPTTQQIEVITFGRLYLAKDGGYVVRVVLDGRGKNTVLEESDLVGDVHYELNYFGHNQPVDIAPPADCGTAGGGDEGDGTAGGFPVPEGAADVVSMPGLVSFGTPQTVDEVAAYYKTEMVNQGWTLSDETSFAGLATLTFTKDGKTANITITPDQASGNTLVLIVEG